MIFPIREGGPNLLSVLGPGGPNPRGDRIRGYTGATQICRNMYDALNHCATAANFTFPQAN